jgi:hypothetical protein
MNLLRVYSDDEVPLWRNLILPEEEKRFFVPKWKGGYRWFRSPNVVCLEHYRRHHPVVTIGRWRSYG